MLRSKFKVPLAVCAAISCVAGMVFDVLGRHANIEIWMVAVLLLLLSGMVLIVLGQE